MEKSSLYLSHSSGPYLAGHCVAIRGPSNQIWPREARDETDDMFVGAGFEIATCVQSRDHRPHTRVRNKREASFA
jgi:hypothetical protein